MQADLTFWQNFMLVAAGPLGVLIGTALAWFIVWRPWLKRLGGRDHG